MENLRNSLGLEDGMSTYFLRCPVEYFKAIGKKPQPYDDNVGEYEFIQAFFDTSEDLENYADILLSKLADNGIIWIGYSIKSDINEQSIARIFSNFDLKPGKTININPGLLTTVLITGSDQ